ncbi:Carboxysome protein CcmN [uncultured Synechococcales cyanobacterium]|uniref:Carboxysome protein CcmN n=1 Tax=uncultured Synechococcales cyanobacterium TaxID=1936017 RepID=A0A6J4VTY8_9CYAN|nr:Carboxysome protein CcmN [uncultured Synechococcales cyanobacterium]
MNLPPLQPVSNSHFYVSGDVTIDPSVAIAPGVILQADQNSHLRIGAGVCIGMGAILHACEGILEVETGANLGAGALVIGKGRIGANACIGPAATIFNCSVEWGQVVPPGSLLGDNSRLSNVQGGGTAATPAAPLASAQFAAAEATISTPAASEPSSDHNPPEPSAPPSPPSNQVLGQEHLNQLLGKLLPYRQSLS